MKNRCPCRLVIKMLDVNLGGPGCESLWGQIFAHIKISELDPSNLNHPACRSRAIHPTVVGFCLITLTLRSFRCIGTRLPMFLARLWSYTLELTCAMDLQLKVDSTTICTHQKGFFSFMTAIHYSHEFTDQIVTKFSKLFRKIVLSSLLFLIYSEAFTL